MSDLAELAVELADEGLYIFPVNAKTKKPVWSKKDSPNGRGGHLAATRDHDEIRALFERGTGIAVHLKKSGLICFDLDYREGEDDRNDAILEWQSEHLEADLSNSIHDSSVVRVHLSQNGGEHWIYKYTGKAKPPGIIMPGIDVKWDGYILWPTGNDGYTVDVETPLDELVEAPAAALRVVERREGASAASSVTVEEAKKNLPAGHSRHASINALVMQYCDQNPGVEPERLWHDFISIELPQYLSEKDVEDRDENPLQLQYDEFDKPKGEVWRMFDSYLSGRQGTGMLAALADHFRDTKSIEDHKLEAMINKKIATIEAGKGDTKWTTTAAIQATNHPDIEWVVENVVPAANLIGLAGPSGAGKTRWMSAFLAAVANGQTDRLGLPECEPAPVLYVANEERVVDVHRRIKAAMISLGIEGEGLVGVKGKDSGIMRLIRGEEEQTEAINEIIADIAGHGVRLVVFDPFVSLGAEEENAADGVAAVISIMQRITEVTDAAVMFVHHTPKGNEAEEMRGDASAFRGSGAIYSALDLGITLFPYIPSACYDRQKGKGMRAQMRYLQRAGELSKYIVLDPAKERENQPFPPQFYRLDSIAVNETGQEIGATALVSQGIADADIMASLDEGSNELERAVNGGSWEEILIDAYGKGSHVLRLDELNSVMEKNKANWVGGARWDRASPKSLLKRLSPQSFIDNHSIQIVREGEGKNTLYRLLIGEISG